MQQYLRSAGVRLQLDLIQKLRTNQLSSNRVPLFLKLKTAPAKFTPIAYRDFALGQIRRDPTQVRFLSRRQLLFLGSWLHADQLALRYAFEKSQPGFRLSRRELCLFLLLLLLIPDLLFFLDNPFEEVLAKLEDFSSPEGIKRVDIRRWPTLPSGYVLDCTYQDGTSKLFGFVGNVNDVQLLFQSLPEKPDIIYERSEMKAWEKRNWIFAFMQACSVGLVLYLLRGAKFDDILNRFTNSHVAKAKVTPGQHTAIRFQDVAGMEQAKREVTEFVDFLTQADNYRQMGARIPKGVLLTGPPGTGKTMLARACAGEAKVSFFTMSGSDFVELFVGFGATKVRELFAQARKEAPSIIFIDEIDAIGRKRHSLSNEENDSTLNQLLVEMDGFDASKTVIVMAATNRSDILDEALKRPGRFDRIVEVELPSLEERAKICLIHLKPLKLDPALSAEEVARRIADLTPGFSGAEIANLCNESAILATRKGKAFVSLKEFEEGAERVMAGYEKKSLWTPELKRRVAIHEAGHAVCSWFLKGGKPLLKLTIVPRSKGSLGFAQYLSDNTHLHTRSDLVDRVSILLGGITSEEVLLGESSTGGSDDLQKVYSVTRSMVGSFGFGKHIRNQIINEEVFLRRESEAFQEQIDREMLAIVEEARAVARQLIVEKRAQIEALVAVLLEKETINKVDIDPILGERPKFDSQ